MTYLPNSCESDFSTLPLEDSYPIHQKASVVFV